MRREKLLKLKIANKAICVIQQYLDTLADESLIEQDEAVQLFNYFRERLYLYEGEEN